VDGALNTLGGVVTLTQGTGIIITGTGGAYTISANTTVLATQAYVTGLGYAPLASPTFTGTSQRPHRPLPTTAQSWRPRLSSKLRATVYLPARSPRWR
jgi:hypothetical protein